MTDTMNTTAMVRGEDMHAAGAITNGHAPITVAELLTAAALHGVGTVALAAVVGVSEKSIKEWKARARGGDGDHVLPAKAQAPALAFLLDPSTAPPRRRRAAVEKPVEALEAVGAETAPADVVPAAGAAPDGVADDRERDLAGADADGAEEAGGAGADDVDDADAEFARQADEQRGKLAAGLGLADNQFAGMDGDALIAAAKDIDAEASGATDVGLAIMDAAIAGRVNEATRGRLQRALSKKLDMSIIDVRAQWEEQESAWLRANGPTPEQIAERAAEAAASARQERETEAAALWAQVAPLALDPDLIDHLLEYVAAQGVVAEQNGSVGIFLTVVSRLSYRPLCLLRRGAAASGKNYLVEAQLKMLSTTAFVQASGGSPRALPYYGGADNRTALSHKLIYIPEAASLAAKGNDENPNALMMRTLISEGRIVYQTVVTSEDGPPETLEIIKDGPIAAIITSARDNIEAELLTRLALADTDESGPQTAGVMASVFDQNGAGRRATPTFDLEFWRAYHRWLELAGPYRVVIPFSRAILAGYSGMRVPLRARRDVSSIIAAISASAIAHKAQRSTAEDGVLVATMQDYENAYRALAGGLAALYKPQAGAGVISLVRCMEALLDAARKGREAKLVEFRGKRGARAPLPPDLGPVTTITVTDRQLMAALGLESRSTVQDRREAAVTAGIIEIVNPTAPRSTPREYRIVTPSAVLLAQMAGAAAMPTPGLVAHYAANAAAGEQAIADHQATLRAAPADVDDAEGAHDVGADDERDV